MPVLFLAFVTLLFGSLSTLIAWPWMGVSVLLLAPIGSSLAVAVAGAWLAYRHKEEPSDLADRIAALHAEKYAAAVNDMNQEWQRRAS